MTRKTNSQKTKSEKTILHKSKLHKTIVQKKRFLISMLLILFTFTGGAPVFANAAEPPAIVIVVADAPSDLMVSVYYDDASQFVEGRKTTNAIESQFKFFGRDLPDNAKYVFEVRYGSERYEIELDKPIYSYHATYTLDLDSKTMTKGESLMRNVKLIGLRVGLTLVLEGAIFWLFGFREKRTWFLFLMMNLFTQGILNFMLSTNPISSSYVILKLIFGELFVFIVEWIVAYTWLKEHSQTRRIVVVTLANIASLVLGGYLITILPV